MADGIYYRDTRPPFATADYGNITLATTMKALWTPAITGTATPNPAALPANYWTAGKTVKLTANLKWTAVANTNAITVGMAYGTADAPAAVVTSAAMAALSSTTVFDVIMQGYATCRTVGNAGTLSMFGFAVIPVGLIASTVATGVPFPSAGVTVVSTIDTTVAGGLFFEAQRATAAGDTVAATNIFCEALN